MATTYCSSGWTGTDWREYFCQQGLAPGQAIAIGGKSLRGIHGERLPGVHLMVGNAHRASMVLAQRGVREKEAELTVAPKVLRSLDLRGMVVTGDALFAQRELCRQIVDAGREYLFTVKGK